MKFKVDKEKCIGCGLCVGMAPSVFDFDDDGKAMVIGEGSEGEEAKVACPTSAISE